MGGLQLIFVNTLLFVISAEGMSMFNSFLIHHAHVGIHIFTTKLSGQGVHTGYYWRSLPCMERFCKRYTTKRYKEHMTKVRTEGFRKWASQLHKKVMDQGSANLFV